VTTKLRCAALLTVAALVVALAAPAGAKTDPTKDKVTAQEAVLKISDFPSGWKDTGSQETPDFSTSSCSKLKSAESSAKKYAAKSDKFESATGFADNTVYVFPTAAAAKSYMKPYATNGKQCLIDSLAKQVKGAKVVVDVIDKSGMVDATKADDGLIFRVTVTQGSTTTIAIQAGVRIGRAFAGFSFQDSTNRTLPEGEDLVVASVDRLTSALG
jgi:hypothetical protein